MSSVSSGESTLKRSELGNQCREVSEVKGKVANPYDFVCGYIMMGYDGLGDM